MAFVLPKDLIARGTHQHCPACTARKIVCQTKFYPLQGERVWPLPVAWFDKGHVDSDGRYICNYHGDSEFNPNHNCKVNDCD